MNFKKSALASAITLASFATGAAAFDASSWEVSGFVKNETAALQKDGTFHGQRTSMLDTGDKNDAGDVIKFENTAKLFINGDLTENAALHAELNFVYDTEATPNDYQGHMNYSQNDYLREFYVDTMVGETEVRVGKQQVVWGTADGIKLLDIINPTDYREFAQNTMEDSRVPVWMIKTDTYVGDTGGLQFIVSQVEENKIAGLNESGDQGNPYIMKGVESITGKVNGFLNIVPALAKTAQSFDNAAGFLSPGATSLVGFAGTTVDNFAQNAQAAFGGDLGYRYLNNIAQAPGDFGLAAANANSYQTNLTNVSGDGFNDVSWDPTNASSAFEYMANATFETFNTFSGAGLSGSSASSRYVKDYPDDSSANFGVRFKNSLDNGLNYSVNYLYSYDTNPHINLGWYDTVTGEKLTVVHAGSALNVPGDATRGSYADVTNVRTRSQIVRDLSGGDPTDTTSVLLKSDSTGKYYGAAANAGTVLAGNPVELRFTESVNRIQNLGSSFDYTVDTESMGGVVLRGEFLYQKDVMQPVVDKLMLSIGDLQNGLTMQESDMFKYVLGADVTVLTNMLVSGQFIQFRNLDYVNESESCTTQAGTSIDCSRYTGDMASLHLTNGMKQAEKNKEFYSMFFSKPFGPNQLGRWNNIFMFEEGGGKWNRFDVEYSFSDELVGSFELNNYWGDTNTQFGQMEDSSNIQVGLKYLF